MWSVKLPTRPSVGDRLSKSRATRVLLIALLVGVCFFLPSKSNAFESDPYLLRTLVARIQFEYEKTTLDENNRRTADQSRFTQTYSLVTRGNFLSRYLLVYDAGVLFSNDDNNYATSDFNTSTKQYDYNLRTTLLPKSAIPLTFYGRYNNQTVSGLNIPLHHSKLIYGLNWFANIKPLPKTFLLLERTNDKSDTTNTVTTNARVRAEKDIGPTKNDFEYIYQNNDDRNSDAFSKSNSFNFRNSTRLSKYTTMSIGGTRSETKNEAGLLPATQGTDITLEGLSMALASKPSQEFNQSHTYTFYRNKSDGTNTGSIYAGDLDYSFSDRLKSHIGLTYTENKGETSTSEFKNQSVSTADNISYILTKNLDISESITYTKSTTNAPAGAAANLGGRSLLRLTTTVAYRENLSFARFTSRYSITYVEDSLTQSPSGRGGKGIEQSVYGGLTDIDLVPHVGFDASAGLFTTKKLSGEIGGRGYDYEVSVYNRSLKKYVKALGTYGKHTSTSWINLFDERKEYYRLSVSSEYFRNTTMRASAEHMNNYSNITNFTSSASQGLSIAHHRRLLGGSLSLLATFNHTTAESAGEPQKVFTNLYEAKYSKPFLKSMFWQLRIARNERTDQSITEKISTVENALILPLRSWLFSLEHAYTLTEGTQTDRKENRFMLKASRSFLRIY